jgi:hypothetical protein
MKGASRQHPFTVSASVALVSLLCLWGSFASYGFETAYQRQNSDPYMISQQFVRFETLLSAVPEGAELGYLTDASPASTTGLAMTLGAQYVLAPRLIEKGATDDRVIGNFTRPADFAAFGQSYRLRLERDFGNGVVLFRKEH